MEEGSVIDCPRCLGKGYLDRKKCNICLGPGRVEYRTQDGIIEAPAGSWLPTKRRGPSGYQILLYGPRKQEMIR